MEVKKIILDRKNLTSTYIELRQELKPILNQARYTKMTEWKSPFFYGAIGLSSVAFAVLLNNETNQRNDDNCTLSDPKISKGISSFYKLQNNFTDKET
jgi:hypothetical protein